MSPVWTPRVACIASRSLASSRARVTNKKTTRWWFFYLVTSACKQAMSLKSHDFIHLEISNYNQQAPEVIKLYEKDLSLRDIEARLGISKTRVRSLLLGAGISLRDSIEERQRATQGTKSKKAVKPPYGFCFDEGRVVRHPKEYPHLLAIIQRWKWVSLSIPLRHG